MTRNSRCSRGHKPRHSGGIRNLWPLLMAAFLLFACFFIVKAACSSSNGSSPKDKTDSVVPGSASALAAGYSDLHIARYAEDKVASNNIRKNYTGFTVSFNPSNHTPDWVGWELLASETDGPASRSNNFWNDEEVAGCAFSSDYKGSGFDRGHLCPSADQKWSQEAMADCFVMTNMAPQDHALNAGAWQTLEKKERLWAKRDSALVIVAGPIYTPDDRRRIGDTGVRVPSAFFKVILAPYVDEPRAIGFIYPNMTAPGNMENYSMTVDEVESITGLDFFSSLPDDIENTVESRKSFTLWNR